MIFALAQLHVHGAVSQVMGLGVLGEEHGARRRNLERFVTGELVEENSEVLGVDPDLVRVVLHHLKSPVAMFNRPDLVLVQVLQYQRPSGLIVVGVHGL